jgi:hypothetical protein
MANKKYQRTIALSRRLQVYPPPKYFGLFSAFVKANEMKESEAAVLMIRCFFDTMSAEEKIRIKRIATERT